MKKVYTCYACGFPMAFEETEVPASCPGCGAPRSQFLEEPWLGSIDKRRIHVDPPKADPNRDPFDLSFHPAKDFIPQKGDGRVRRWVMYYKKGTAGETRSFYEDLFGWDILDVEGTDNENPVMYCATGPGTPDWEPRVCSFGYGFLVPFEDNGEVPEPSMVIEVKNIDETVKKALECGGKLIREKFVFLGDTYAAIRDSEGNPYYLWELPDNVPDYCIHGVANTGAQ
ncbi:MAG: hypothetical protein KHW62_04390 [Clostridiales bacterium]|nr:hypothetical protein [Clostridiales bacterium]